MAVLRTLTALALLAPGAPALQDDLLDDLLGDELDALLEGDAPSESGAGPISALRDWKGFVELKPRAYLENGGAKEDAQLLFRSELELDFRFSDEVTAYFRPRVFVDALDGDLGRFEPFEAYVTWEGDGWDLRGGQFVENWGIVDTYNPIDVVNRRDFASDPLDAERLGELGVRYRRTFAGGETVGEPTLSFYALPVFRETRFAPADQRLGPGSPALPFDESGGFEPEGEDRGLYAARFQSTLDTSFANADVQVLAAHGPSRTPAFVVDSGVLVPAYFGTDTVGAGFRAVPNEDAAGHFLATLTFKAEVVYAAPYDFDGSPIAVPDDYVSYVVGVDRSFYHVVDEADELTLTLEYAGESGADDAAGLLRPFRDDLIARGFYQANDFARQSLELRSLVDLDVDEQVFELIYERQLRSIDEDLKLTVQAQVIEAANPGESFFASLEELSSVAIGLRWDL